MGRRYTLMNADVVSARKVVLCVLVFALLDSACAGATPSAAELLLPVVATLPAATATAVPPTPTAPFPSPTETPTLTPTPTITPTPDPYAGLTIADLAGRAYGGGELRTEETLAVTAAFTRTLITYPSDGLTIYGFMNVPASRGEGPFPVVIALHGYINPAVYDTLDYTTRYADTLARAGYLVIHPNLRGYAPSDDGPNPFRVGFAVDVLNLIAIVRERGGKPGPLELADPDAIGLWGHSMGGGVSIRVITVSPYVRAAVLYGSMSGDEQKNFERILVWSGGLSGQEELDTPAEDLLRISPIYHLDRIRTAVSIHHGDADETVPLPWSLDLCEQLRALSKPVECYTYDGQPHTFEGEGDRLFRARVVEFFDEWLKGS